MSCEPRIEKPDRAALGSAAWRLLHAEADALEDTPAAMRVFVQTAWNTVDIYPCHTCRANARAECSEHLAMLHGGGWWRGGDALERRKRQGALPNRTVAVAWAARFHACVTAHLPSGTQISAESAAIAAEVNRLWQLEKRTGKQSDEAITCYIDGLSKAGAPSHARAALAR